MSHKKHLWAPWKMEYIKNKDRSQKIFSDKPNEDEDRENFILYRGKTCYVIMNYYPYNNGHLMVVPYEEKNAIEDFFPLSCNFCAALKAILVAREVLPIEGLPAIIIRSDL